MHENLILLCLDNRIIYDELNINFFFQLSTYMGHIPWECVLYKITSYYFVPLVIILGSFMQCVRIIRDNLILLDFSSGDHIWGHVLYMTS